MVEYPSKDTIKVAMVVNNSSKTIHIFLSKILNSANLNSISNNNTRISHNNHTSNSILINSLKWICTRARMQMLGQMKLFRS